LRGDTTRVGDILAIYEQPARPIPVQVLTIQGTRCRVLFDLGEMDGARRAFDAWAPVARAVAGENVVNFWNALCIERALFEFADAPLLTELYAVYAPQADWRTYVLGSLDEMRGNMALQLGRVGEAEAWYEQGMQWARREHCDMDEGLCLQGLGDVALRRGRRAEARRLFGEASSRFEATGARLFFGRVEARMAALGGTVVQPAQPVYPDGLSGREVEVLRLIAAGRSNPQIAEELVISLNTVQRHVSNILAKTGAANRTEAAVYARDRGIV
jgi:DNA-binding CsgD family transcriptional regulator